MAMHGRRLRALISVSETLFMVIWCLYENANAVHDFVAGARVADARLGVSSGGNRAGLLVKAWARDERGTRRRDC